MAIVMDFIFSKFFIFSPKKVKFRFDLYVINTIVWRYEIGG
jgi:hypothetical protein